jgi:hypothetical protein
MRSSSAFSGSNASKWYQAADHFPSGFERLFTGRSSRSSGRIFFATTLLLYMRRISSPSISKENAPAGNFLAIHAHSTWQAAFSLCNPHACPILGCVWKCARKNIAFLGISSDFRHTIFAKMTPDSVLADLVKLYDSGEITRSEFQQRVRALPTASIVRVADILNEAVSKPNRA